MSTNIKICPDNCSALYIKDGHKVGVQGRLTTPIIVCSSNERPHPHIRKPSRDWAERSRGDKGTHVRAVRVMIAGTLPLAWLVHSVVVAAIGDRHGWVFLLIAHILDGSGKPYEGVPSSSSHLPNAIDLVWLAYL
ncbi:hypothetical protein J6590_005170 [Homalodisca vitripennis]|nr:hypothetical protein J6590_005170 [Homalodisca vitripennis]